ncbi:MAG: hypothetical protein ABIH25_03450 [Candidatus Woesearchaeota archaeon]
MEFSDTLRSELDYFDNYIMPPIKDEDYRLAAIELDECVTILRGLIDSEPHIWPSIRAYVNDLVDKMDLLKTFCEMGCTIHVDSLVEELYDKMPNYRTMVGDLVESDDYTIDSQL